MVIGQNGKAEDIELNVCKTKHLTNTRTSSSDEALRLTPPRILSLEQALDFIDKEDVNKRQLFASASANFSCIRITSVISCSVNCAAASSSD